MVANPEEINGMDKGYLRVHEVTPRKCPELLVLPSVDKGIDVSPVYPGGVEYFNEKLFWTNRDILSAYVEMSSYRGKLMKDGLVRSLYPILGEVPPAQLIRMMEKLKTAESVDVTLSQRIDHDVDVGELVTPLEMMNRSIHDLTHFRGKLCVVSASDLTNMYLISTLSTLGIPMDEIGLVVLDHHLDMNLHANEDEDPIISKASLLMPLLSLGIGGITHIGLPNKGAREYTDGIVEFNGSTMHIDQALNQLMADDPYQEHEDTLNAVKVERTYRLYQCFASQLKLAGDIFTPKGKTDQKQLMAALEGQMRFLKGRGVRYVFPIVDLDVADLLREGITATPYNPMAAVTALGMQDFGILLRRFGIENKSDFVALIKRLRGQYEYFDRCRTRTASKQPFSQETVRGIRQNAAAISNAGQALLEALQVISDPVANPDLFLGQRVDRTHQGGLMIGDIVGVMDYIKDYCSHNGQEYGLPIKSEGGVTGHICGSISEVSGLDVDGKTADAVLRIADAMEG